MLYSRRLFLPCVEWLTHTFLARLLVAAESYDALCLCRLIAILARLLSALAFALGSRRRAREDVEPRVRLVCAQTGGGEGSCLSADQRHMLVGLR